MPDTHLTESVFFKELSKLLDPDRLIHDPIRTLAYGCDASLYRLTPQLVVKANNENEIIQLLSLAHSHRVPVTFRAAGTSLSGQALSDSVLVMTGDSWNHISVLNEGQQIQLQNGVIGSQANQALKKYKRKIGPDPASINAARIGGIAANNASGMCCGTHNNSYQTLESIRLIFADGTVLDTANQQSIESFRSSHASWLQGLSQLRQQILDNNSLKQLITKKYSIKNTTGYCLNALIDFEDPIDILSHLIIGSEGTLAFISSITYNTIEDHEHKATALVFFSDIHQACSLVPLLKTAKAVELMDQKSLMAVVDHLPPHPSLSKTSCALLIECQSNTATLLEQDVMAVENVIAKECGDNKAHFTYHADDREQLWKVRKGLFPSVGATRKAGRTVIIEDIAVPCEDLAQATLDLQDLLNRHAYEDAVIFGHAKDGNLHFVFTQNFNEKEESTRYQNFMSELSQLVVDQYQGSLKAEHGTGRNMAPFVEKEWGNEAYNLMSEIKKILDPLGILNPGVILNNDSMVHLKNIKSLPQVDTLIDACVECGFVKAAALRETSHSHLGNALS